MGTNLLTIIKYIDVSVDFSGTIDIGEIDDLLELYPINGEEKNLVFKRIEDLGASVIYTDEIFKSKLFKLYNYIDSNKQITNTKLEKWVKDESINNDMKQKVLEGLAYCGYIITLDNYTNSMMNEIV